MFNTGLIRLAEVNVLTPPIVCVPAVSTPPKEPSAGCKFNTLPPLKLIPLALGVEPIAATEKANGI